MTFAHGVDNNMNWTCKAISHTMAAVFQKILDQLQLWGLIPWNMCKTSTTHTRKIHSKFKEIMMDFFMVVLGKYIRKYFKNKRNEQYMYIIILVRKILTLCKTLWRRITIYLNSKTIFFINKLMRCSLKKIYKIFVQQSWKNI